VLVRARAERRLFTKPEDAPVATMVFAIIAILEFVLYT
jgi:hypothetical protein